MPVPPPDHAPGATAAATVPAADSVDGTANVADSINATATATERFDTVILGAGIAGASLAWQLAQRGAARRTLLLERESQPGYHSTGRSAAMYMASYGPPGVRALTRAAGAFYRAPPPGFADVPLLAPRGALYVAAAGQGEALQALHDALAPACPRLAWLDAAAARALAPCLREEGLLGALLDPDSMDIDVHALHQAYLRGFRRQGGVLRCGAELVEPQRDGTGWRLRFADGHALRAARVVLAAGAWADTLGARFGAAPIGLQPRRRSAFTFDAPAGVDVSAWPAVVAVDESWYFKPDAGRLLGSPANADATVPHDVQPEVLDIALGIDRIEAATTLSIRRPGATWAGLRSFVADGEPVIGWDEGCPGLFWLAGQGGYGIQSAAGAAALAAALLSDAPLPDALQHEGVAAARFAPRRLRLLAAG